MKILHGIDITNLSRKEFVNKKLVERFLHTNELKTLANISDNNDKIKFIASRWAIKEAIFKALDQYKIAFNKINITHINYCPTVELEDYNTTISVSYEGDLVIASAILYSK